MKQEIPRVVHLSLFCLFNIPATGSYHSTAQVFSEFSVNAVCIHNNCDSKIHENLRILSLRGGAEAKEGSTLPFGGPNPKDEFDASDEAAQPKSDTIYVPSDVNSVPEAVEVRPVHG